MQTIIKLDKYLFHLINGQFTNSFLDWILPWLRNPMVWIPLYLFIFLFLLINLKKQGAWIIVFMILTVSLTDSISSHLFKPFFNRLRPCSDPEMYGMVRLFLNYTPRNGSFTSSHAANHFGIAFFLFHSLKTYFANKLWPFFLWAFFISYAQVYIGVHYPMDILGGAILGCLVAYFTSFLLKSGLYNKDSYTMKSFK
jgi:undecaprenyl-diphosphatase